MLGYTFKINDPKAASSSRYTAQFYIDMNNDGRFDEELEGLSYMGITLASNNKKILNQTPCRQAWNTDW